MCPISEHMQNVLWVADSVTEEIKLYKFRVSNDEISQLFQKCKSKRIFSLIDCYLELDSVPIFEDFLAGSRIEVFSLSGWGKKEYWDWWNHLGHFNNLIEGLSKCQDFVKNLQEIVLTMWSMEKDDVLDKLEQHEFGKYGNFKIIFD